MDYFVWKKLFDKNNFESDKSAWGIVVVIIFADKKFIKERLYCQDEVRPVKYSQPLNLSTNGFCVTSGARQRPEWELHLTVLPY